jgi:hypothetical protein
VLGRAQDLLDPFLYGEQRGFAGVFDYRNNYPIEQFRAPLDNVCVTEGNGVKAAWIDCNHEFGSTEWGGVGECPSGGMGEWDSGAVGEWESGKAGDVENLPSSFFLLPSSFFLLPSTFSWNELCRKFRGFACRPQTASAKARN